MRICVVIPSEGYTRQAGFRIRYQRIEQELTRLGHSLRFCGITEIPASLEEDLYLISKCYDARSFLAMHRVRAHGKLVGFDLFDDYFSQTGDSRFMRLRRWLMTSLEHVDFVLCSTPAIQEFISQLAPVPTHILNDPVEGVDGEVIHNALARKPMGGPLDVAWFGMGDNPNFPVGLDDLVAHAGELARIEGDDISLRLTILTNSRALTAEALANLARLPIEHIVEEWDEAAERKLLLKSHLAFLPVNAQNFSVAKSLNRALTALSAGCQVLSVGYPLYEQLDEFIYRNPSELGEDWLAGRLRLRAETVPALLERLTHFAAPATEAESTVRFLASLGNAVRRDESAPARCAVVFGSENHVEMYNFARSVGAVSVRSPFSHSARNFDLRIDWSKARGGYDVYVEARAIRRMSPGRHELFAEPVSMGNGLYAKLVDLSGIPLDVWLNGSVGDMKDKIDMTASYPTTLRFILWIARYLFPLEAVFVSEELRLPLSFDDDFAAEAA